MEFEPAPRPVPAHAPWAEDWLTIGVTGTNGKTSTTTMIAAILRASGRGVFSVTTLDYQINGARQPSAPRTWEAFVDTAARASACGCRHAVVEITSQALAHGYARRWRYDIGVFTNLAEDHIKAHGSLERYLASKAQLFLNLTPGRSAALNAHDPASLMLERVMPEDIDIVWYGLPSRGPRLRATARGLGAREVSLSPRGTTIALERCALAERLGADTLEIPMIGDVFAENALAAAAAALAAGVDGAAVRRGLASCPPVPGRFELVRERPAVVIDYAHTADALARTCDAARKLAGGGRVIVVFGAGGGADPDKRGPMGEAVGARVDLAIVTSDNPRDEAPARIATAVAAGCRRGGRGQVVIELDRAAAIERGVGAAGAGDVVVIAGKGHETGQVIGGETVPFCDREVALRVCARSLPPDSRDTCDDPASGPAGR